MEIYLIRHTTLTIGKEYCYGQTDAECADTFEQEAQIIQNKVKISENAVFYASPLNRCVQLAQKFSPDFIIDHRLKELNFGHWEHTKWEEIPKEELNQWMKDFVNQPCPQGESFMELAGRVQLFWEEMITKHQDSAQNIYLFTHGGVIRCILSFLLEFPLQKAFTLDLDYGSVSLVRYQAGFYKIAYINR
jgi:alpha-ribazole phosphatase